MSNRDDVYPEILPPCPLSCLSDHIPLPTALGSRILVASDTIAWILFVIFYLCSIGEKTERKKLLIFWLFWLINHMSFFSLHKCLFLDLSYHVRNATCWNKQRFIYCAERTFCAQWLIWKPYYQLISTVPIIDLPAIY